MSKTMTVTEVKAKMLALVDEVARGEEVEITKHGRLVARLVPPAGPAALEGKFAGVAKSAADDDLVTAGASWDPS